MKKIIQYLTLVMCLPVGAHTSYIAGAEEAVHSEGKTPVRAMFEKASHALNAAGANGTTIDFISSGPNRVHFKGVTSPSKMQKENATFVKIDEGSIEYNPEENYLSFIVENMPIVTPQIVGYVNKAEVYINRGGLISVNAFSEISKEGMGLFIDRVSSYVYKQCECAHGENKGLDDVISNERDLAESLDSFSANMDVSVQYDGKASLVYSYRENKKRVAWTSLNIAGGNMGFLSGMMNSKNTSLAEISKAIVPLLSSVDLSSIVVGLDMRAHYGRDYKKSISAILMAFSDFNSLPGGTFYEKLESLKDSDLLSHRLEYYMIDELMSSGELVIELRRASTEPLFALMASKSILAMEGDFDIYVNGLILPSDLKRYVFSGLYMADRSPDDGSTEGLTSH